jgi:hypothetical protein
MTQLLDEERPSKINKMVAVRAPTQERIMYQIEA